MRPGGCHVVKEANGSGVRWAVPDEISPDVGSVDSRLDHGLALPFVVRPRRAVCRQAHQRESDAVCFCQGRSVVKGCCATRARDGHRLTQGLRHAQGVVGGGPLIQGHGTRKSQWAKGLNQGCIAGPGTEYNSAESTLGESGGETCRGRHGPCTSCIHSAQWTIGSRTARSLFRVSFHSATGLDAAVMPPPA